MKTQTKSRLVRVKAISSTALALRPFLLAACGGLLLSGCIVYGPPRRVVMVRNPPPPVVVEEPAYPVGSEIVVEGAPPTTTVDEVVTVSPGPEYVWIPGVWVWEGRWVWGPGHWTRPPRPGAIWVPNRYEFRGGVHVFIRGGWR